MYLHVEQAVAKLGLTPRESPTTGMLIALYVTGLILLDTRQTQTRVTHILPGRCHDALNRLLRIMPLSTRALMRCLMAWVQRLDGSGYLSLDDVVVEKPFAKRLPWAGWTYSFAQKRKVYGLHIVLLVWCSTDGRWRIPVAFRLWRPARSCASLAYRTKGQLAERMLVEIRAAGLQFDYVVFDTHYTAGWLTKKLDRMGCRWQGTLPPNTTVVWHGRREPVARLAKRLKLKWRTRLSLRATALFITAPKYGTLRLVITRNRHGNIEYLVSNDQDADLTTVVLRKRSRWSVETVFRDTKQFAGLANCQCWGDQAMVRHVSLVLCTFVILQMLRGSPTESVGAVKERWQLTVIQAGERPPAPLRARPSNLRHTA